MREEMKLTIDKASIVVDQALAHGYNPSSGASADKDETCVIAGIKAAGWNIRFDHQWRQE
jgi:hypothetical protein